MSTHQKLALFTRLNILLILMTLLQTLRQDKSRFYLIVEPILTLSLSTNLVRKVNN